MSDFTPEQVERAAGALCRQKTGNWWADISEWSKTFYREDALKILSAAGAPEKVAPVVDEAELADLLSEHVVGKPNGGTASSSWCRCSCGYKEDRAGVDRSYVERLVVRHQAGRRIFAG